MSYDTGPQTLADCIGPPVPVRLRHLRAGEQYTLGAYVVGLMTNDTIRPVAVVDFRWLVGTQEAHDGFHRLCRWMYGADLELQVGGLRLTNPRLSNYRYEERANGLGVATNVTLYAMLPADGRLPAAPIASPVVIRFTSRPDVYMVGGLAIHLVV